MKTTDERIEEIILHVKEAGSTFDPLDEIILKSRLESLVIQAQLELLQKK